MSIKSSALNEITARMIRLSEIIRLRDPEIVGQKDFAVSIGANHASISNWKAGKQHCTLYHVHQAVAKYKVSPMWLITGAGEVFMDAPRLGEFGGMERVRQLERRLLEIEAKIRKPLASKKKRSAARG